VYTVESNGGVALITVPAFNGYASSYTTLPLSLLLSTLTNTFLSAFFNELVSGLVLSSQFKRKKLARQIKRMATNRLLMCIIFNPHLLAHKNR
jgi:hypothetical protein